MKDGLYQVDYKTFCAGFVVENGKVTQCAPILRKNLEHWKTEALYIGNQNRMQITIVAVSIEHMPGKNGGYDKAEVAYKGEDGKVSGKNLVSFNAPDAFAVIKTATTGDVLDVTAEKDAKGYWQWVKVVRAEVGTKTSSAAVDGATKVSAVKNTYETPEERALKQLYIVRQSSINASLAFYKDVSGEAASIESVLKLAREFEAYVYRKEVFADFKGDEKDII